MKHQILFVTSHGDYAAAKFESCYKGKKVADIIPNLNLENGEEIEDSQIDYDVIEIEVEDIIAFRNLFSWIVTDRNHKNFYIDTQVL